MLDAFNKMRDCVPGLQLLLNQWDRNYKMLYLYQMMETMARFTRELVEMAEKYEGEILASSEKPFLTNTHNIIKMNIEKLINKVPVALFTRWLHDLQTALSRWPTQDFEYLKVAMPSNWIALHQEVELWKAASVLTESFEQYEKGSVSIHEIYERFKGFKQYYLLNAKRMSFPWEIDSLLSLVETVIEQRAELNNAFIQTKGVSSLTI